MWSSWSASSLNRSMSHRHEDAREKECAVRPPIHASRAEEVVQRTLSSSFLFPNATLILPCVLFCVVFGGIIRVSTDHSKCKAEGKTIASEQRELVGRVSASSSDIVKQRIHDNGVRGNLRAWRERVVLENNALSCCKEDVSCCVVMQKVMRFGWLLGSTVQSERVSESCRVRAWPEVISAGFPGELDG